MQHLDEGTIHSWLDGALSPEEATRVAVHVASCKQCAEAVAEARGLISVSSRILGALDAVPDQVIPKRDQRSGKPWYRRPSFQSAIGLAAAAVGVFWVVNQAPTSNELNRDSTVAIARDTAVVSRSAADTPSLVAAPLAYDERSTEPALGASASAQKTVDGSAALKRERTNAQAREKRAVAKSAPIVSQNTASRSALPAPKIDTANKAQATVYFEMAAASPHLVYFAKCDTLEVKVYDVEPNGRAMLTIRDRTLVDSMKGVSKGVIGAKRPITSLDSEDSKSAKKPNSLSEDVIARSRVSRRPAPQSCAEALSQYSPSDTTVSVLRWSDSTNQRSYVLKSKMPLQSLNSLREQLRRSEQSDR